MPKLLTIVSRGLFLTCVGTFILPTSESSRGSLALRNVTLGECNSTNNDPTPADSNTLKASPGMTEEYFCVPLQNLKELDDGRIDGLEDREMYYVDITGFGDDGGDVKLQVDDATIGQIQSCILPPLEVTEGGTIRLAKIYTEEMNIAGVGYLSVSGTSLLFQFYDALILLHITGVRPVQNEYFLSELPVSFFLFYLLNEARNNSLPLSRNLYAVCAIREGRAEDIDEMAVPLPNLGENSLCQTFKPIKNVQFTVHNMDIDTEKIDVVFRGQPHVEIAIIHADDCSNHTLIQTAQNITITRDDIPPPTTTSSKTLPEPSSSPAPPTTPDSSTDSTLPDGGIAGITVAAVVIIAGVVVVTAVFIFIRRKRIKPIRERPEEGLGNIELEESADTEIRGNQLTYIWNLNPGLATSMTKLLAEDEGGEIPHHLKNDSMALISFIRSDKCKTFYIIRYEGRDQLRNTNPVAWELLRDFNTRAFDTRTLNKLVDIRIYDEREEREEVKEEVPGPILTINVSLQKWNGNQVERADLIKSRVKIHQGGAEDFDGSQTPSGKGSPPRPGHLSEPGQNTVSEHLPGRHPDSGYSHSQPNPSSETTSPPPSYRSSSNSQPTFTVQTDHPHASSSPPTQNQSPPPSSSQPTAQAQDQHTSLQIQLLERIAKNTGEIAKNTKITAENTGEQVETGRDTQEMVGEMHNKVMQPPSDTPENM